jgi:hypothetical protein
MAGTEISYCAMLTLELLSRVNSNGVVDCARVVATKIGAT